MLTYLSRPHNLEGEAPFSRFSMNNLPFINSIVKRERLMFVKSICHKSEGKRNGFARRCGAVFCMGGGGLVWEFRQVVGRFAGNILQVV